MRYVLLALLVGCTGSSTGPEVVLVYDQTVPSAAQDYIRMGAEEWHELGFEVVDASELPACSRQWYTDGSDPTDCSITIGLSMDDLAIDGTEYAGLASREYRTIILSTRLDASSYSKRMELWAIATHELGHILLDTGHLAAGERGVMSAPYPTGDDDGHTPTEADYTRACASIGVCL